MLSRVVLALCATLLLIVTEVSLTRAQQTPTPSAQGYRGTGQESLYTGDFSDIAITIDTFWSEHFQTAEVPYTSPGIVPLDQLRQTACGPHGPGSGALYCTLDSTIYLSPFFLAEKDDAVGDYAPITILAHEWGHHVQFLTDAPDPGGNTFELQADCLAGVYTQNAEEQGLLDPGDISEAVTISRDSGDPLGLPQELGLRLHGTNDERIKSFMSGYLNGLEACGLPFQEGQTPRSENTDQADPPRQPPVRLSVPNALPLAHADCFRIENDNAPTFEELAARLGGTDETRAQLQNWGWQASANRVFACDTPPDGEAGWIDISLHLFADGASARQAVDFFAAQRAEGSMLRSGAPPAIGDHAAVLSGPATNGKEFTLYVSQGPLMIRVTGVSTTGIPFINVLTVAQALLALPLPQTQTQAQPPSAQDVVVDLPSILPLGHASCFRVDSEGTLDFAAVVERFPGVPDAPYRLQDLGWQAGAYRQFGCDTPPPDHAGWIDISVHQFQDAASAAAAVPFFASSRALGSNLQAAPAPSLGDSTVALTGPASNGTEYTLYMSTGSLLVRITGVAPVGDPVLDVDEVMMEVLAESIVVGQGNAPSAELPAPPTPVPTAVFIPTATAVLAPTAPMPTPTPLPQPTAPTAPTPTVVPQPTATPRVVQAPATVEMIPLPTPTAMPSSVGCQLVELYPGYPGFQGYVAGIDGPGEVGCLNDLVEADPRFDRAAEDAANLAAAREIGLTGSPADWTWENWMAIDAERGLPLTCYSCLFANDDPPPARESAEWDPSDPRLQMGGYETGDALAQAAVGAGMGPNSAAFFQEEFGGDHVLRAFIGLTWPGHHTAPEMLDAYDVLFAGYAQPSSSFLDPGELWDTMLDQGGYAPTPSTAHIEDQMYMVRTGVEALCAPGGITDCDSALLQYDHVEAQFLNEVMRSGPDISYAEWLREKFGDFF